MTDLPCGAATFESSLMDVRDRATVAIPQTFLKGEGCVLFQCVLVAVDSLAFIFNFHNWQL